MSLEHIAAILPRALQEVGACACGNRAYATLDGVARCRRCHKEACDTIDTWRNDKGNRRGNSLRGPAKKVRRGPNNPQWKGDAARTQSKRCRAQKMYELGTCERCEKAPATDRHHKDGDTGHNERENIALLCRRCHMIEDGRLDALRQYKPPKKGDRPCANCSAPTPQLNRGRCRRCAAYFWRFKKERPAYLFANRGA